jgi:hypothetical protein
MESRHKGLPVVVPCPGRIRSISGTRFGWIDAAFLEKDWMMTLPPEAVAIYTFLCLAGNRQGVSWYRNETIRRFLSLNYAQFHRAQDRLLRLELAVFQPFFAGSPDGYHQVLPLPSGYPDDRMAYGPDDRVDDE